MKRLHIPVTQKHGRQPDPLQPYALQPQHRDAWHTDDPSVRPRPRNQELRESLVSNARDDGILDCHIPSPGGMARPCCHEEKLVADCARSYEGLDGQLWIPGEYRRGRCQ